MKKLLTFIAITSIVTAAKAQTNWITYKVDNHISLKFPKQPVTLKPGTIGVMDADSVKYGISTIDLSKAANIDSATLATMKENPEFIDQMRTSMQQTGKVTIEPFKLSTWHGLTSYTSSGVGLDNKKLNMLLIIYGATIYDIFTISPPNTNTKNGELFLNSATFTN